MSDDGDSVEWVTVKLHKQVRDQARDDPRTYTQIMRDGLETDRFTGERENVDAEAKRVLEDLQNTVKDMDVPDALAYEDVVAASERGARNALEDLQ